MWEMPEQFHLRILWLIWSAYRNARKTGVAYAGSDIGGVHDMAVFIGIGRDARLVQEAAIGICIKENERIDREGFAEKETK